MEDIIQNKNRYSKLKTKNKTQKRLLRVSSHACLGMQILCMSMEKAVQPLAKAAAHRSMHDNFVAVERLNSDAHRQTAAFRLQGRASLSCLTWGWARPWMSHGKRPTAHIQSKLHLQCMYSRIAGVAAHGRPLRRARAHACSFFYTTTRTTPPSSCFHICGNLSELIEKNIATSSVERHVLQCGVTRSTCSSS